MIPEHSALAARTRALMRALRKPTLARDDVLERAVDRPFVFYAPNLCGEYAVFVFGSYRCEKYLRGQCTPCHYSGLPHPSPGLTRDVVYQGLHTQLEHLLEHFDALVLARQRGTGAGYRLRFPHPGGLFADLQIAGEGSWLADREIPPEHRLRMLRRLAGFARERRLNLHVGLEVKAEDVLQAEASGELEAYGEFVEDLDLSLILGFESADPFVRNVIFNKDLCLDEVERAIAIGHARDMRPTCFVYAGNHGMTEDEVVDDVAASIAWLRERGAGIYLMFPNLQPHTLSHLLYHAGHHRLIDVRTAARLVELLLEGGRGESPVHFHAGHDWNIGGLTSEPDPELTVFGNPHGASCPACRERFQRAVWYLAQEHDEVGYREQIEAIRDCGEGCEVRYGESLRELVTAVPLVARVAENLERAEALLPEYQPKRAVVRTGPGGG